ncbi:hypothetical protein Asppvi_010295 [Aspergillus pseudoviridinutans]|uniref:Uncharacterized protein n=1 Tax=Aspergillus pseudoviridinutans TaxID=1517512 RepID=A0A9P3EZY5_9EURO|nr:uncharacterized protein Asppvi_010295 [Aspergillus pseudoviridinutans]GIJ91330.1 hypothetical protein Asppvi_010295 [Aspergillus pseudoviridinutans]
MTSEEADKRLLLPPRPPPATPGASAMPGPPPSKRQRREEDIRRDERHRISRIIAENGIELPEEVQAGLGVPQLRSDLSRAQLARVDELHEEFIARKGEREEKRKQRMAAKEALNAAQQAYNEANAAWEAADAAGIAGVDPERAGGHAQKLHLEELDDEWAAAKLAREEVHKMRKAAREAVEKAQKELEELNKAWEAANNAVKKVSAEKRLFYEEHDDQRGKGDNGGGTESFADDAVKLRPNLTRVQRLREEAKMRQKEAKGRGARCGRRPRAQGNRGRLDKIKAEWRKEHLEEDLEESKGIKDQHLERKRQLERTIAGLNEELQTPDAAFRDAKTSISEVVRKLSKEVKNQRLQQKRELQDEISQLEEEISGLQAEAEAEASFRQMEADIRDVVRKLIKVHRQEWVTGLILQMDMYGLASTLHSDIAEENLEMWKAALSAGTSRTDEWTQTPMPKKQSVS